MHPALGNLKTQEAIMSKKEILENLKKFAPPERLAVIEAALQQLRADLEHAKPPALPLDRKQQLTSAAEALYSDYVADGELTAFTILDSEDFHA